jgi:mRNA-degrading endonuclease RelE of RelBE toxin-antitoxin system
MDVRYKPSFSRDLRKIKSDSELVRLLFNTINNLKAAKNIEGIYHLKKLEDYTIFYRVKIKLSEKREYRLVVAIRGNIIWLLRFLPRHKVYDEFP